MANAIRSLARNDTDAYPQAPLYADGLPGVFVDIANTAIALDEQDRADTLQIINVLRNKGNPIKEVRVAIDAFDFFVHTSNPVTSLTFDNLKDIYRGVITNWQQIGGNNQPIIVYHTGPPTRPGGGTTDGRAIAIQKWFLDFSEITGIDVQEDRNNGSPLTIIQRVATDPNGIGYDGAYFVNQNLSVSSLNIIGPDRAVNSIVGDEPSRRFPVARYLSMLIRENDTSHDAMAFLEYTLQPTAQEIIGGLVLPMLPPARTFEVGIIPKGKLQLEQKFSFREYVSSSQNFLFNLEDETEFVIYARNNTLNDGTSPKLTGANGMPKGLGVLKYWIEDHMTILTPPVGLANCNITEFTLSVAPGDVMSFYYNGQKINITFGSAPCDKCFSGCNVIGSLVMAGFFILTFVIMSSVLNQVG
jgi:ABC-type phosphate transport system substrate-binding protein